MTFEDWLVQFWPPDRWPMTLSDIERWRVAYNAVDRAAREECAAICDARAMKCENEITTELSQDEIVELRSLAWQFSVLAQQIRNTIKEGW